MGWRRVRLVALVKRKSVGRQQLSAWELGEGLLIPSMSWVQFSTEVQTPIWEPWKMPFGKG